MSLPKAGRDVRVVDCCIAGVSEMHYRYSQLMLLLEAAYPVALPAADIVYLVYRMDGLDDWTIERYREFRPRKTV